MFLISSNNTSYPGFKINQCEWTGNLTHEQGLISITEGISDDVNELLKNKELVYAVKNTDYVVMQLIWGDNKEYMTELYPGDIVIKVDGKFIPFCGKQVNLVFKVNEVC